MTSRTHRIPGLVLTEHELEVPLDHDDPQSPPLTLFARVVADADGGADKPCLLFLQGGPGHEATRPTGAPVSPGWLARALQDFRVVLLDQRGTGRSSPVGADLPGTPQEQATYLTHFRADAIVRDAELLREHLGVRRWGLLGQSFGGLCAMTYLSTAPDALDLVLITGGLAPLGHHPDELYAATFARMLDRSRAYYDRYPEDRERVRALQQDPPTLPSGDVLTPRRLRQVGERLGMGDGAESLHHLLELPPGSPAFLHDLDAALPFARNPIYAVLHEACMADGHATRWSAQRVLPDVYAEEPELFTGEHIFPWMFDEYAALAPLKAAAELLAEHPWPRLYDEDALAANEVPAAAAIYANDAYVERRFSEETAARIKGLRPWLTSEFEHNGLRADGERVLGHLLDLARGRA
ncbi:alpha/beta fold hydrolase [Conexibacter sp. SYSU D00693]|uniref:alpha/beta fold hydrolase n=1 Tax=Conexibacter sp. SYSU D00693 TaxID=2812560 RepID=UPI00196AE7A6|nr:alpha/beta fold hydrolase [Conexibacter sp. SYSU D00693]